MPPAFEPAISWPGRVWAGAAGLAAPALRLMLWRRARRGKEIESRLPEREGIDAAPRPAGRLIWLHAASVGESQSVLPVVERLLAETQAAETREAEAQGAETSVLMTTGTVTSADLLARQLPGFGGRVLHRFVPLDVPAWAARFLDHWRPDAAAFVESELWPNLLSACRRRSIPLMLINARMSARSARGWARAPRFAREVLGAFDRIHPQSAADGERLLALGARSLEAPGNLKLSAPPLPADAAELARLRAILAERPVWLAASTHAGEEAIAADVHRALAPSHPGLLTLIAPRHPERGAALAQSLGAPRRAAGEGPPAMGVWIVDTLGELGLLYRLAPLVFMGKSLVGAGGQNPLEPARLGCAIAIGPRFANFVDPVERLRAAGGLTVVDDAAALAGWVDRMLQDLGARQAAGAAARAAAAGEAALPGRIAATLRDMLPR